MKRYRVNRKRALAAAGVLLAVALVATAAALWRPFGRAAADAESDRKRNAADAAPSPSVQLSPSPDAAVSPGAEHGAASGGSELSSLPWNLMLVNDRHAVPEGWSITPSNIRAAQCVDSRILDDLQDMMDDCRAAGYRPLVCSGYRTQEKQRELFDERVQEVMATGITGEEAEEKAAETVAVPGHSEHQLGLAVDIVAEDDQVLWNQVGTEMQAWLLEHAPEYGFVRRYPKSKESVTGIREEVWHYRYVGKEAAQAMTQSGQCLEEYIQSLGYTL